MKPDLEIWQSSHNRHEKHWFIRDGRSHGYQEGQYLLGLNPDLVTSEQEEAILKLLEPIWQKLDFGAELP